jgi:hypothetical protein
MSARLNKDAELSKRRDAVIEADFLEDFPVPDTQNRGPGEVIRPVPAGNEPIRKSSKAGPVCVPPPSHWPTT